MTATNTEAAPSLKQMEEDVYRVNFENGWFESDRTIGEDFALIHSEISEALEAYRDWGVVDMTRQRCSKIIPHTGQHHDDHICKPLGVGSELADIVVRILDTTKRRNTYLPWDYLEEVPERELHGETFGEHIDQLHALATARELGALLAAVKYVAHLSKVDLQAEFERKLLFNATRGHKHGGKRL